MYSVWMWYDKTRTLIQVSFQQMSQVSGLISGAEVELDF